MPTIDGRHLEFLQNVQSGVLARRQLIEAGVTDNDIERMVRRRDLTVVVRGIYVNHTGPLSRRQREWVAVLSAWPAALCAESAIPGVSSPVIQVAIANHRTITPIPGARLQSMAQLEERVDWRAAPPQVRVAHAVIDVMSQRIKDDDIAGAYAVLAQACFSATTPDRICRTLSRRARIAGRPLIEGMLEDLRTGACSVLERGYVYRVERPHGLPRASRQHPSLATGSRTAQDVRYKRYGLVVELNGRFIHDRPESWDSDARRDLAELATSDAVTARVTYGLVFREQCATAGWIGAILRRRGWDGGTLQRCPRCPPPA